MTCIGKMPCTSLVDDEAERAGARATKSAKPLSSISAALR